MIGGSLRKQFRTSTQCDRSSSLF